MAPLDVPTLGRHTRLADSDSDDEPQNVLSLAKASDLCPMPHRLVARSQKITSLADLSSLSALDYIDLADNSLTSIEGIDHPRLKTLIVAKNNLTQIKQVYKLSTIRILNVSENHLPDLEWLPHTAFAAHLLTLVASSNQLHSLAGVMSLSSLETLVISNNALEDLTPITHLTTLVKLSASNNQIRNLPPLTSLEQLVELRLAHNRISKLPEGRLSKLKILDVGHNRLAEIASLSSFAPALVQVNLRENPVGGRDNFDEYVKVLCDRIEVINGQRIAGGRRKVRVNRIRKAVGFEIEHGRKFARMPSDYYLRLVREKDSPKRPVKEPKEVEQGQNVKRKRTETDNEDDAEMEAETFVEMARARAKERQKHGGLNVIVHGRRERAEGKKRKRERSKRDEEPETPRCLLKENFGDGGSSQW